MHGYVRQQSAGDIIRGALKIYGENFFTIFFTYILLMYPFAALQAIAEAEAALSLFWVGAFLTYVCTSSLAGGVITISISDICLGYKPSVWRSYTRVVGVLLGKLLVTDLLTILIVMIGFTLLIVPGFLFLAWVIIVGPVVILEGTWGVNAFKRSKSLGRGYYLRNAGLLMILIVMSGLIGQLLRVLGNIIAATFDFVENWVINLFLLPLSEVFAPILLISTILMYYDLRVRKEAYDNAALAEDLKH